MSVKLTSEALGHPVGYVYTGPEEPWLLANGYAKRDADTSPTSYTGPGVAETGPSDVDPEDDVTLAENREPEPSRNKYGEPDSGPRDPAMGFSDSPKPAYDFDAGGVNTEAPSDFVVSPAELPLEGGEVTAEGQNFTGVTGVTVGGEDATDVTVVDDSTLTFVAPAMVAGAYDVVVTNADGSKTETAALTYAA